jgi:hypothetical protein
MLYHHFIDKFGDARQICRLRGGNKQKKKELEKESYHHNISILLDTEAQHC